jgi:hypothetical protein
MFKQLLSPHVITSWGRDTGGGGRGEIHMIRYENEHKEGKRQKTKNRVVRVGGEKQLY